MKPVQAIIALLQTDAHSGRGRKRRKRPPSTTMAPSRSRGAATLAPRIASFVAAPRNQHRHRKRQCQERQQYAAAPYAERQRRADGTDQAEGQRRQARRPTIPGTPSPAHPVTGRQRRHERKGDAGQQPCAAVLAKRSQASDCPERRTVRACRRARRRGTETRVRAATPGAPRSIGLRRRSRASARARVKSPAGRESSRWQKRRAAARVASACAGRAQVAREHHARRRSAGCAHGDAKSRPRTDSAALASSW